MALPKGEIISAQAVLLPASGQPISPDAQITSRNLAQFEPSPEAVEQASRLFRALGFQVGGMAGISFSITAPVGTFREVFKARLQRSAAGGIQCLGDQGASRLGTAARLPAPGTSPASPGGDFYPAA